MTAHLNRIESKNPWEDLSDNELLKTRVRDLKLQIKGTVLEDRIYRLYAELDAKNIQFHPPCYLADEWLCPDRVPVIGIPFYLTHPRLANLERRMMLEVEGGTDSWCMKLLRHESGHALNYAYQCYRKTRWRELFGNFSTRYSSSYSARPYSKRFVVHLEDNYAQAHPDEDFAETFAVWLTPNSRWNERYQDWPAIRKLNYVDSLMKRIGSQPPKDFLYTTPWSASRMTSTLEVYYERKRRYLGDDFPGFYNPGLERIFFKKPAIDDRSRKASLFLKRHRKHIINSVSMWSGQRKYDIDKLIRKLADRCDDLGLWLHRSEEETIFETTSFITAVMCNIRSFKRIAFGK